MTGGGSLKGEVEWVTLKSGERLPASLGGITVAGIRILFEYAPAGLSEFIDLCRDPKHQVQQQYRELLESVNLLRQSQPRPEVRAIVLAAAEGEGLDLHLIDPVTRQ